jgi:RNA polymerase sigma-70 factor (ECF subfamily)
LLKGACKLNWEKIWSDYGREIYLYIYIRVQNKQEAEDLTQETFLKAIRAQDRYQEGEIQVTALLKTIARHLIIDKWRRNKNELPTFPIEPDLFMSEIGSNIEKLVEQKDEIRRALSLLNEEQNKVINLRLLQGYSIKETATVLGKSEAFVKVTQFRAVKKIKNLLRIQLNEED